MRSGTHYCVQKRFVHFGAVTIVVAIVLVMAAVFIGPMVLLPRFGSNDNNRWVHYTDTDTAFVFVHGIFSDSDECWTYREEERPENNRFWPELIAKDKRFEGASVFAAGYYTGIRAGRLGIDDAAEEVWEAMNRPISPATQKLLEKKNIIFICHSTGGIVARYLLWKHYDELRTRNIGIVLIASPSAGSELANKAGVLSSLYDARLAGQLRPGSDVLSDLDANFRDLLHYRRLPNVAGIEAYEHRALFWGRFMVVPQESAGRYFGRAKLLRDSDHFSCVKPSSERHPAYGLVLDFYRDDFKPMTMRDARCRKPFEIATREWQTESGTLAHAALSPDGQSLAYVETEAGLQRLMLRTVDRTNSARPLVEGILGRDFIGVTFDPAGDFVYYVRSIPDHPQVHSLRRVTLDGNTDDEVLMDVDSAVAFNPANPRELAFCHGDPGRGQSSIYVARLQGSVARAEREETPRAVKQLPETLNAVTWSPTGSILLAVSASLARQRMSLVAVNGDGKSKTIETSQEWRTIDSPRWLKTNDILFTGERAEGGPTRIWLTTSAGRTTPITHDLNDYSSLSVSFDETRLMALNSVTDSRVYRLPYAPNGRPRLVARSSSRYDGLTGLAATGPETAVFTRRTRYGQDLVHSDIATGKTRVLASGTINDWPVVCGNDVVFTRVREDGTKNIWRVSLQNDAQPVALTQGQWDAHPSCSANGSRIVYSSLVGPRRTVWMLENGSARQLIDIPATQPAISPDGKRVAITYADVTNHFKRRFAMYDIETSTLHQLPSLDIASERAPRLQWRDNEFVSLVDRTGGELKLVSYPTSSGAAPVTEPLFGLHTVFNFSWTPGRNAVMYAGGDVRRDAVLLAEQAR